MENKDKKIKELEDEINKRDSSFVNYIFVLIGIAVVLFCVLVFLEVNQEEGTINNCYAYLFTFDNKVDNTTTFYSEGRYGVKYDFNKRSGKKGWLLRNMYEYGDYYEFPLEVSLEFCGIPYKKVYETFDDFPLEDDCLDEDKTKCFVKWEIK